MFLRKTTAERAASAIDRTAEHAAVRSSEIHILEYAAAQLTRGERMRRLKSVAVDRDDFTRFDVALDRRTDDVECTRLGGEDPGVTKSAHRQRPPATRVTSGQQRVAHGDDQAVGAFDDRQRIGKTLTGRRCI